MESFQWIKNLQERASHVSQSPFDDSKRCPFYRSQQGERVGLDEKVDHDQDFCDYCREPYFRLKGFERFGLSNPGLYKMAEEGAFKNGFMPEDEARTLGYLPPLPGVLEEVPFDKVEEKPTEEPKSKPAEYSKRGRGRGKERGGIGSRGRGRGRGVFAPPSESSTDPGRPIIEDLTEAGPSSRGRSSGRERFGNDESAAVAETISDPGPTKGNEMEKSGPSLRGNKRGRGRGRGAENSVEARGKQGPGEPKESQNLSWNQMAWLPNLTHMDNSTLRSRLTIKQHEIFVAMMRERQNKGQLSSKFDKEKFKEYKKALQEEHVEYNNYLRTNKAENAANSLCIRTNFFNTNVGQFFYERFIGKINNMLLTLDAKYWPGETPMVLSSTIQTYVPVSSSVPSSLQFMNHLLEIGKNGRIRCPDLTRKATLSGDQNLITAKYPSKDAGIEDGLFATDANLDVLVQKYGPQFVMSSGTARLLFAQTDLSHGNSWSIPVYVKNTNINGQLRKIIYFEKPIPCSLPLSAPRVFTFAKYALKSVVLDRKFDLEAARKFTPAAAKRAQDFVPTQRDLDNFQAEQRKQEPQSGAEGDSGLFEEVPDFDKVETALVLKPVSPQKPLDDERKAAGADPKSTDDEDDDGSDEEKQLEIDCEPEVEQGTGDEEGSDWETEESADENSSAQLFTPRRSGRIRTNSSKEPETAIEIGPDQAEGKGAETEETSVPISPSGEPKRARNEEEVQDNEDKEENTEKVDEPVTPRRSTRRMGRSASNFEDTSTEKSQRKSSRRKSADKEENGESSESAKPKVAFRKRGRPKKSDAAESVKADEPPAKNVTLPSKAKGKKSAEKAEKAEKKPSKLKGKQKTSNAPVANEEGAVPKSTEPDLLSDLLGHIMEKTNQQESFTEEDKEQDMEEEALEDIRSGKFKIPPKGRCYRYGMWNLSSPYGRAPISLLIRSKPDGMYKSTRKRNQPDKYQNVSLLPRIERLPDYGSQVLSDEEYLHHYFTSTLKRSKLHLMINVGMGLRRKQMFKQPYEHHILGVQELRLEYKTQTEYQRNLIDSRTVFANRLLNDIIQKVVVESPIGSGDETFLLDKSPDGTIRLLPAVSSEDSRATVDLTTHYRGPEAVKKLTIDECPWQDIDPEVLLQYHAITKRVPATFRPRQDDERVNIKVSKKQKNKKSKMGGGKRAKRRNLEREESAKKIEETEDKSSKEALHDNSEKDESPSKSESQTSLATVSTMESAPSMSTDSAETNVTDTNEGNQPKPGVEEFMF